MKVIEKAHLNNKYHYYGASGLYGRWSSQLDAFICVNRTLETWHVDTVNYELFRPLQDSGHNTPGQYTVSDRIFQKTIEGCL